MEDLNADVSQLQNPRNKQVANFLDYFRLVEFLGYFRQQLQFLHRQIWFQVRQVKLLCSRCTYILGIELCLFKTVVIQEPWNFSSDRFSLCSSLLRWTNRCHGRYLRGRQKKPLRLPTTGTLR